MVLVLVSFVTSLLSETAVLNIIMNQDHEHTDQFFGFQSVKDPAGDQLSRVSPKIT